jgi:DNA (cytosine-5)-methyltransferase 1
VAENVGGLFSADDGVALARCIRELLDSGACETGWRLLDSQYFGVAQRRKRVFIVSDFGGESVDEILAITESLPGHPAPSREAGKGTAGDATKGVGEGGDVVGSLAARDYKGVGNQYFNEGKVIAQNPIVSWNGDTTPKASEDVSVTLRSQQGGEGVGVAHALTVRRLTPIECERLQGFPDNWTSEKMELILEGNEWKATGKVLKQADGPRYKAMGNAVTVNVAEYLGKQIGKVLNG